MEFLLQYGMFILKTLTLAFAIIVTVAAVAGIIVSIGRKVKHKVEITALDKQYADVKAELYRLAKNKKINKKQKNKTKPALYVIDFHGDLKASQVEQLRDIITIVLDVAEEKDQVVLCLESSGGTVNGYGLAAAQLQRIRDKKITLTVCIDQVAASGGYLMACVANSIVAAPFAIIGSIGVVAQLPNFHRWLKKNNIDFEMLTAGEYKRTLTLFGENTTKGRQKFQEDLEKIHLAFRDFVLANRPNLDVSQVTTGEHWLATDALKLGLVDRLQTSDEFLNHRMAEFNAFKITIPEKRSLLDKFIKPTMQWLQYNLKLPL